MIRPVFTELVLFLVPFVAYALFLWATRRGVLHPANWQLTHVLWLMIGAFLCVIASFIVLAQWSGSPPGSTYTPAHVENGKLVPAKTEFKKKKKKDSDKNNVSEKRP
jgi:quinol-cytochrome oxidoreductase complex cytochrome b subunit